MDVTKKSSFKNRESRLKSNNKIIQFEEALKQSHSQRNAEKLTSIPRTSYQYWNKRQQSCNLDEVVKVFFQQPEGLEFLHRITLAADFVITQLCGSGIGSLKTFYELSQLDQLAATSFGSLHKRISTLENNLSLFGKQQFDKLKQDMPAKEITCALDETFPSGICLVGMDVESNFILLEVFAEKRDCYTWEQAMNNGLSGLPVKVIQVVSDEAKALIKYTRDCLEAHHSPDVFHVQQDIIKATTPKLRAQIKTKRATLDEANDCLQAWIEEKTAIETCSVKPVGRPVNYDRHIDEAAQGQAAAIDELLIAVTRREDVSEANRNIGNDYHPFDLESGEKITTKILEKKLDHHFDLIEQHAENAELSENSIKKIQKARRVVESMTLTLNFFWCWVSTHIEGLELSAETSSIFEEYLLPIAYLELHIPKARDAKQKHQRRKLCEQLRAKLNGKNCWQLETEKQQQELKIQAKKCARIFQRSSSCVEGRNGQLSLKHHASRKMCPRKLAASTVIHNYFIVRSDGTTAAERLFGKKTDNLFEWLLENTDYPALPAKKRPNVQSLSQAA